MEAPQPHWTAYVSALLTPAIAFFAVYVASSQWTTARNKLRFDLFEKRFAIYEGARHFLGSIMTSGKVKEEEVFKYLVATQGARWIVSPEVHDFLEREVYKPALNLQCLDAELEGLPVGDDRAKNVKQQSEIKKHLNDQFEQLDIWFNAYLRLEH